MPHEGANIFPTAPIGAIIATVGGVVAQATPTTGVGAAGLIASIAGLLMAGFQYFKVIMDARSQGRQLAEVRAELEANRKKRHDDANRFNAKFAEVQVQLIESNIKVARLEGQLGQTDKTHASAINANSENIGAIAQRTGTDLPVNAAHVEPIISDSDSGIRSFPELPGNPESGLSPKP